MWQENELVRQLQTTRSKYLANADRKLIKSSFQNDIFHAHSYEIGSCFLMLQLQERWYQLTVLVGSNMATFYIFSRATEKLI
jgi:hypothetical protein